MDQTGNNGRPRNYLRLFRKNRRRGLLTDDRMYGKGK